MFNNQQILELIIAALVGAVFVAVTSVSYRVTLSQVHHFLRRVQQKSNRLLNSFLQTVRSSLIYVASRIARLVRLLGSAGKAAGLFVFAWLAHRARQNWQFFAGIAFTLISLSALSLSMGASVQVDLPQSVSAIQRGVRQPSRHVVDTTRSWEYDFSKQPDGQIDTTVWNIESGTTKADYNNELQTYTNRPDNVRVEDGALILEAKPESRDGKAYTSGRVDTNESFSFVYGKLEVEAQLPRGVGTWPAAWLLPSSYRYQPQDFPNATDSTRLWTLNGELDFLEAVGYQPGQNIPAAHSYNSLGRPPVNTPGFVANPYDTYHRYGIIKTPSAIQFTIDDRIYASREKTSDNPLDWPFDQAYHLVLNLAIGGKWAGRYGVDDKSAPWQYKIKSVRYSPLAD